MKSITELGKTMLGMGANMWLGASLAVSGGRKKLIKLLAKKGYTESQLQEMSNKDLKKLIGGK